MRARQIGTWGLALLFISSCGAGSSKDSAGRGAGVTAPGIPGATGAGTSASNGGAFGNTGGTSPSGSPAPGGSAGAGGVVTPPPLPPEMPVKLDFELPQASQRFVYAANPKGGTVSIIDATTQNIQTLETGDKPTFLRTLAGTDNAIVLNVGSNDATILRTPDQGATTSTVPVFAGANAIAVAPDGKHAVVYFNASYSTAGNDSGSFQDVTVITLADGADTATGMTVGFSPRDVAFTA
ncbi:MAG: YncE family protein, partial [Polyangiales bacterium]